MAKWPAVCIVNNGVAYQYHRLIDVTINGSHQRQLILIGYVTMTAIMAYNGVTARQRQQHNGSLRCSGNMAYLVCGAQSAYVA